MATIDDLIMAAVDGGADVTIRVTPTADGQPGAVSMPNEWIRKLGGDVDKIRAMANQR